ncbi:MAG: C39 family peptidase [Halobacteriovoraceae bacterium]|nr:C39 family peptidase [Halobacteriovoraceae bacterium]
MKNQPDYTTCGPTSLHAVYSFYNDKIGLEQIVDDINQFDQGGGTLAVILGKHAIKRGYHATMFCFNIKVFDPSWFEKGNDFIRKCINKSIDTGKMSEKRLFTLKEYEEYLRFGGDLKFRDLSQELLKSVLDTKVPILTGLSSTWLYRDKREDPIKNEYDDILGSPAGHFVIIDGYENNGQFSICDPYQKNPINSTNHYLINGDRLINSILLGISSYDGNLLIIEKKK